MLFFIHVSACMYRNGDMHAHTSAHMSACMAMPLSACIVAHMSACMSTHTCLLAGLNTCRYFWRLSGRADGERRGLDRIGG